MIALVEGLGEDGGLGVSRRGAEHCQEQAHCAEIPAKECWCVPPHGSGIANPSMGWTNTRKVGHPLRGVKR